MALSTLERINKIMIDLSYYNVNQNWLAVKNNLLELYKETDPFLSKPAKTNAKNYWKEINNHNVHFDKKGNLVFADKVIPLLNKFDFWLRNQLKKNHLLMASSDDPGEAFK